MFGYITQKACTLVYDVERITHGRSLKQSIDPILYKRTYTSMSPENLRGQGLIEIIQGTVQY